MLKGTSKTVDALVEQLHTYLSNQQPSSTAATACGEPEEHADRLLLGTGGGGEVVDTVLGGGVLDAKANTMLRSVRACMRFGVVPVQPSLRYTVRSKLSLCTELTLHCQRECLGCPLQAGADRLVVAAGGAVGRGLEVGVDQGEPQTTTCDKDLRLASLNCPHLALKLASCREKELARREEEAQAEMASCREEVALSQGRAAKAEGDRTRQEQELTRITEECDAAHRMTAQLEKELENAVRERELAVKMASDWSRSKDEMAGLLRGLDELVREFETERRGVAQLFQDLCDKAQQSQAAAVEHGACLSSMEKELHQIIQEMRLVMCQHLHHPSPDIEFALKVQLANCSKGDGRDYELLNGVYIRTPELANGLPVYLNVNNHAEALWYDSEDRSIGGWRVGPRDNVGTTTGHASVMSGATSPELATAGMVTSARLVSRVFQRSFGW